MRWRPLGWVDPTADPVQEFDARRRRNLLKHRYPRFWRLAGTAESLGLLLAVIALGVFIAFIIVVVANGIEAMF